MHLMCNNHQRFCRLSCLMVNSEMPSERENVNLKISVFITSVLSLCDTVERRIAISGRSDDSTLGGDGSAVVDSSSAPQLPSSCIYLK